MVSVVPPPKPPAPDPPSPLTADDYRMLARVMVQMVDVIAAQQSTIAQLTDDLDEFRRRSAS